MKKLLILVCLFGLAAFTQAQAPKVVASTTWVGAIAQAAGAGEVLVLAPIDLRHPAEYDFRASDIQKALQADYVIWAGYEPFIRQIIEAAKIPSERVIQVYTNNSPPVLKDSVGALAQAMGTLEAYQRWATELDQLAEELLAAAKRAGVGEIPIAVQAHQRVWIEWLGYQVVAAFGPGEITPNQVSQVLKAEPKLIIDNWHSPQGQPFGGDGREYISLINFPGIFGTGDLLDVLRYNGRALGLLD